MTSIDVSIIIPCYNEERTISQLLDAIRQQTFPYSKTEVIIADGMSTDRTRQEIEAFHQKHPDMVIRVVENNRRTIPSAVNCAIDATQGKYIVRMDAHSKPAKDYVQRCVKALEEGLGDNVGGVWDIKPSKDTWIAKAIAASASHRLGVGNAQYRYTDKAGIVDTVPFGAVKREVFDNIGKYDETLLSNEDYEFNVRLKNSGGKIWLDPEIRTIYYSRGNLRDLAKQYWRYGYWKWRMVRRYPDSIRLRQALPPLFTLSLLGLSLLSFIWWLARLLLGIELLLYITVLFVSTIPIAIRKKELHLLIGMPLSIATMHLSWGSGFLWSLLSSIIANRQKQKV